MDLAGHDVDSSPTHSLPSLQLSELLPLEAKFIANVHPKNPIVDPEALRRHIHHIAENGLDWSTETCLVALVCALGAYSQAYDPEDGFSQEIADSTDSDKLAREYWGIAIKRLGVVIGENNTAAIQCLNLAGYVHYSAAPLLVSNGRQRLLRRIWHMYNMDPLRAWKCFNLASNAWYTNIYSRP